MQKNRFVLVGVITAFVACCCNILAQSLDVKESDQYYTSFDGIKIHCEVFGDGFPVLLVHGFISDGQTWKKALLFNDLLVAGYKGHRPRHERKWKVG
jgi:hypothetical protein